MWLLQRIHSSFDLWQMGCYPTHYAELQLFQRSTLDIRNQSGWTHHPKEDSRMFGVPTIHCLLSPTLLRQLNKRCLVCLSHGPVQIKMLWLNKNWQLRTALGTISFLNDKAVVRIAKLPRLRETGRELTRLPTNLEIHLITPNVPLGKMLPRCGKITQI